MHDYIESITKNTRHKILNRIIPTNEGDSSNSGKQFGMKITFRN